MPVPTLSVSDYIRVALHAIAAALSISTLGYLVSLTRQGATLLAYYYVVVRILAQVLPFWDYIDH